MDLGVRWIATTVNSANPRPRFYGRQLRRVKGHYFHLRRALAMKRAYKAIRKVGHKEGRVVNDILRKISRAIVDEACKNNSLIVLGTSTEP